MLNGRSLQPLGCDEISVVELCARFLAHAQGYYVKDGRPTGAIAGFKAVIKYLRLWYGRDPASRFGPLALKALRQRMVDDGHSRRYVNDHVAPHQADLQMGRRRRACPCGNARRTSAGDRTSSRTDDRP